MCKIKLLFVFFALLGSSVSAQLFNGGISLGFSGSQVDGDGWSGYNKPNLLAGIFVENSEILPKTNFLVETSYLGKGSRFFDQHTNYSYQISLHYVQMRIRFEYSFYKSYFAAAGISPGILVKASVAENKIKAPDELLNFRLFDVPLSAGLGMRINKNWSGLLMVSYSPISIKPYVWFRNNELVFSLNRYISL